jgi:alpha,alpha-trehalase
MHPATTATSLNLPANRYSALLTFIRDHWDDTKRFAPNDVGDRLGLPFPYTVPCRDDIFQDLYYWDASYANEGLMAQGRVDLARHNVDNMLHLINRYGFMPNGNRTFFLTRSQPPHLGFMVERVFAHTGDLAWLDQALVGLEVEHAFWQANRLAPCGLNHYGHQAPDAELIASWDNPDGRPGHTKETPATDADKIRIAGYSYAECESGWDFSPRFDHRSPDFCPADLNALLYASERVIAHGHHLLGREQRSNEWEKRAARRASLMRKLLWSPELGAFADYDHVNNRRSSLVSAAIFYPVWLGPANAAEASSTLDLLPRLERPHGLLTCEPGPRSRVCQWDAPNAWAPLQYAAIRALQVGGRHSDAQRLAGKFLDTVARNLTTTGDLWEKYNAETGDIQVQDEYKMPTMMGWTAGVCAALAEPDETPDSSGEVQRD